MISSGADLDIQDYVLGATALMAALFEGRTETAKALVDAGADVNIRAKSGATAMLIAERSGSAEILEILKKANVRE